MTCGLSIKNHLNNNIPVAAKVFRSRWFMLFFSVGLFVFLLEVSLRLTGTYKNYGERNYGAFIDYTRPPYPGPLAAWGPDSVYRNKTMEFDYEISTNSLGIRDTEHTVNKPAGTRRVAVIGDSFSQGVGAPFDSTWGNRLGFYLNNDSLCGKWEIIQGSAAGSDPFYAFEMYRRHLWKYNADVVIATYNHTDLSDFLAHGGMERFVNDTITQWRPVPKLLHTAYKWSHLVRMAVKSILGWNDFYQSPEEEARLTEESVDEYADLFLNFDLLVQLNNARLWVIIQPMHYECNDGKYPATTLLLKERLMNEGISVIDLMEQLPENMLQNCDSFYWEIDGHMNNNGYDAWAKTVYELNSPFWCPVGD